MTHLKVRLLVKVTCSIINFHEIAYATLASPMFMTHFEVETRKFWIKSNVALCSVDSWALVHYCIVNVNLKFNLTTTIMFVVIIKLKSHFQLSFILTIANAIVLMKLRPILTGQSLTDHRMRKKAERERDF